MKTTYKNLDEVSKELKRLKLKRDISVEEIKLIKHQFKDDLSYANWIKTIASTAGKLGLKKLINKLVN